MHGRRHVTRLSDLGDLGAPAADLGADLGAEHAAGANDAAAAAQAKAENARRNGSRARMDDAKTKRLDAYKRDEREMRELRRLMAGELEVYRFAKEERYETQWEEPLRTC